MCHVCFIERTMFMKSMQLVTVLEVKNVIRMDLVLLDVQVRDVVALGLS